MSCGILLSVFESRSAKVLFREEWSKLSAFFKK